MRIVTPTRMQTVTPTQTVARDGSPGDGSPGDGSPGDDGTIGDGPGETCGDGMVYDCSMACVFAHRPRLMSATGTAMTAPRAWTMCEESDSTAATVQAALEPMRTATACRTRAGAEAAGDGGSTGRGAPGDDCGPGMVYDCAMACVARSTATGYVGDGYWMMAPSVSIS